ncbi:MAG: GNAT family N-acetyltransferase [Clostridiales bacterium]|nr:GNAT family N-acetyltransferase [Clostridiales bacterium]
MRESAAALETPRLLLRKAVPADTESLYRSLWSRPEAARYMLWQPTATWEEAWQRMGRTIAHQRDHLAWTICEKSTGKAIGFAGITPLSPGVYEDTGLALSPDCWRQGYGREALEALVACCFHRLGGTALVCSCRRENTASRQLQLSCSFRYTHSEERTDPRDGGAYVVDFYRRERDSGC